MIQQPSAELIATTFETYDAPTPWEQARDRLRDAHDTYWLAVTRPDGSPHVRPVLGVWADEHLHFVSGSTTRKTRYLTGNPHISITVSADGIDLVAEGTAERVTDLASLRRVADAYQTKYGWHATPRDAAFNDTEGAPTAGPPPYNVYRVALAKIMGFPVGESYSPTRWTHHTKNP
jgi:nitroimidazol reductase NimA-like FMN-containing flavoprotein (pyridoxamine 5'-phosphate oxidase superfamily)